MADIVLVHGWGRGSKSFDALKVLLEKRGHVVYAPDLPGFGVASPPDTAWGIDEYAVFVRDYIEKRDLRDFYLYGHSFGGQIAVKLAATRPVRLQGLILASAAGIRPRPSVKVSIFQFFSAIGKMVFSLSVASAFREPVRKFVYWLSGERDYYHLQAPVMKEIFKKVIREDLTDYFQKISVPTLIVWGENDKMTPLADAHTMHTNIPGSRLEILEGVGHTPHVECPEKVAELMDTFINSNDIASR
ncbi:alpha/beta hydrolase [Candidatus Wolfebacteria bacterium]|nr:alpha/beta hydrolase [Candidatus Wolfebacteria bacterium]